MLNRANFNVEPNQANTLNVTVIYHERLERGAQKVFETIRDYVNGYNATFRFGAQATMVKAGKFFFISVAAMAVVIRL